MTFPPNVCLRVLRSYVAPCSEVVEVVRRIYRRISVFCFDSGSPHAPHAWLLLEEPFYTLYKHNTELSGTVLAVLVEDNICFSFVVDVDIM